MTDEKENVAEGNRCVLKTFMQFFGKIGGSGDVTSSWRVLLCL